MLEINKKNIILILLIIFYSQGLYKFTEDILVFNIVDTAISYFVVPALGGVSLMNLIRISEFRIDKGLFIPFLVLICISFTTIYNTTDILWSVMALVKLWLAIGVAYWIYDNFTKRDLIDAILLCQAILIVFQLLYYILFSGSFFGNYGDKIVFSGAFPHKNHLSSYMAFVNALYYISFRQKQYSIVNLICFIVSVIMMVFSGGFAGVVGGIVAIIVIEYINVFSLNINISVIGIGANFIAMMLTSAGENVEKYFLENFNRDLTFTGRTQIWEMLGKYISEKPLFGYGYCSFWECYPDINSVLLKYGSSHNGWYEFIIQFGIIGTVMIGVVYLIIGNVLKQKVRLEGCKEFYFEIIFLITQLVYMISERSFQPFHYHTLFFIYTVISILSCRKLAEEGEM